MFKFLIGIVVPYFGVIGLLPWAASKDVYVGGIPFVYAWIFAWFILTSFCLWLCWTLFDKRAATGRTAKGA